jgi:signal transduction histidine kinase/CheY-like chemotaxis protein
MWTAETRSAAVSRFLGANGQSAEVSARMSDGRLLTLVLTTSHIELDGVPCFVVTGFDLTRQREFEDALRQSEAQARTAELALRRANEQKDEFIALLSHELRNPLTPILTSARLLEQGVDPELRGDVDVIVRQVKHVSRLVDDLVDVSRVARGAVTLSKTRLEPATVIARAAAATAPLFKERGHRLEIDVPEHGLAVEADEVRLTQIFDNLLSNAARYTPPNGTVSVSGRREGDMVEFRFRDTGRGIEPSLLPEVFEIFVQAPRGPDRAEGGLGVGLSLVRALTELHGGTVTVHSDGHDLGTEFTVRLPAAAPNSQYAAASPLLARSEKNTHSVGARVLIVDDHKEVASSLTRLMRLLGYDVRTELSPVAALAAAKEFLPEIALLDIGLPGMDGYRLAAELRASLGDMTPVLIALSGYSQPRDLRHSQASGFAAHLTKPVDADDLVATLDKFAPSSHRPARERPLDEPWAGGDEAR